MLLWGDGFEGYGDDETNLLDGVYANISGNIASDLFTTGAKSWKFSSIGGLSSFDGLRKVLPGSRDKLGAGARLYFPNLPTENYKAGIFEFLPSTSTARSQISFTLGLNGEIHIIKNAQTYGGEFTDGGGVVIAETDPIIVASAFNHVEVQSYIHDTDGWVRVAVNGIHRYEETGLDTKGSGSSSVVSSVAQSRALLTDANTVWYMDDYYIYDFEGDPAVYTDWCPTTDGVTGVATNYMGEWDLYPLVMNGDTAEADFVPSSGLIGFDMVDELTPNDADYLSSNTAGDLTEFAMSDLPVDYTVIRALMLMGRLSKSDSGPAMTRYGMRSVAAVTDAPERPITVEPTYWWDFINKSPLTNARWTRAELNAAFARLTRSA